MATHVLPAFARAQAANAQIESVNPANNYYFVRAARFEPFRPLDRRTLL